jgi:hypothetical protein
MAQLNTEEGKHGSNAHYLVTAQHLQDRHLSWQRGNGWFPTGRPCRNMSPGWKPAATKSVKENSSQ